MGFYTKSYLRSLSETDLVKGTKTFSHVLNENRRLEQFDIFLSHSYKDKEYIKGLFVELTNMGFAVYVDWIIDPHLSRNRVDKETVEHLRMRMKQSKSLVYATSNNSADSKWMPWELGYMDGRTGQCSILPITDYESSTFSGQEFLSVYPYIKKEGIKDRPNEKALWVHETNSKYVIFNSWLSGVKPVYH